MSNFYQLIDHVLEAEGGYSNHPNDKGGPTNFGIILSTLRSWRRNPNLQASDVKNLDIDEAREIYKARYWDPLSLDAVESMVVADIIFDQGINRGTKTIAKQVQKACNKLGSKLVIDGDIGPRSIEAINGHYEEALWNEIFKGAQHSYISIVKRNPSQIVFLTGWINRTHKLLDRRG